MIPASAWAFAELERVGYRYSSSMVPVRHDLYGFPGAPRFRHHPIGTTQLIECPASTVDVGGRLWACGGGGYFRFFPHQVHVGRVPAWISRTGYSGELGYELFVRRTDAEALWSALVGSGVKLYGNVIIANPAPSADLDLL
ncbi:DUF3473 domain-containing protein [bacterium]|nr:DUF3473 domain-containing protein [bacterium]